MSMYTIIEEEFYQWFKQRFDISIADASMFAQFIVDIKKEREQLLNKTACIN